MKMTSKALWVNFAACCLLAKGQSTIDIDFSEVIRDGQNYRAFEFQTDEFLTYRIQSSTNAKNWNDLNTFHGVNETILFPFAPIGAEQAGGGSSSPPSPTINLSLKRAIGGGVIATW